MPQVKAWGIFIFDTLDDFSSFLFSDLTIINWSLTDSSFVLDGFVGLLNF